MAENILVLGGGESGIGAAILAKSKGFNVFLSDNNKIIDHYKNILLTYEIPHEEEGHERALHFETDLVIKSPGIPDKVEIVQKFLKNGAQIFSEIEFASKYTKAFIIAVTGSNGKTTTSLLTYHVLNQAGLSVGLAGNIGKSFAWQVAENNFDYYVLEVSSFQLDNIKDFRPNISVILNITPDHLDRYDYSFDKYIDAKFKITQNQQAGDTLIYFADSQVLNDELEKRKPKVNLFPITLSKSLDRGGFIQDNKLVSVTGNNQLEQSLADLPIKGPHNAINALAVIAISQQLHIANSTICKALVSFKNAPHRLEQIAIINGVTWVNDSKATNVDSVYYALGSFDKPIILIAGGVDKGNDYSQIEALVIQKVTGLIVLSKDYQKLLDYFNGKVDQIMHTESLDNAILTAQSWSNPGDVVLFSPACASFDLFNNYEDRGNQFRERVEKLP